MLAVVGFTLALGAGCGKQPVERVVLITIDTLRADHVGCYGAVDVPTPTLDALADHGARFENAISPAPLTLPSHATLLTGLDPPHHGVRDNGTFRLGDDFTTLAERFAQSGFATAAFVSAVVLDRQHGLAQGFDVYDDQMSRRRAIRDGIAERTADAVVGAVLDWAESAPERFFLWAHLFDPHADYEPPPGFRAAAPSSPYAGEIAFADSQVGRLLAALDERFDSGQTLVVVTSDHGESLGEHGELSHSLSVYDATQRVPLLLRGPGVPAGRVVAEVVRLADVAPTLLDLAGLQPIAGTTGRSLLPLMRGQSLEAEPAFVETLATQLDFGWSPLLGLRTDEYKYVRAPRPELYALREDPDELRNLAAERPEVIAALDAELAARLVGALPVAPGLVPSEVERERLESLGYVVATPGRAEAALGRVGGTDPKDGMSELTRMRALKPLIQHGRGREALDKLGPPVEESYFASLFRVEVAVEAEDWAEAERAARRAVALKPGDSTAHLSLGVALEGAGRVVEARSAYEAAARLAPGDGEPLLGLGRLAAAQRRPEEARRWFEQAAGSRTAPAEATWQLAALRLEAGDPTGAAQVLSGLPAKTVRQPAPALRLAEAARRGGLPEEARTRLQEALAQTPGHVGVEAALGR